MIVGQATAQTQWADSIQDDFAERYYSTSPDAEKKSRRTKNTLIVFIILILLALGGVVYLGYLLVIDQQPEHMTPVAPPIDVINDLSDNTTTNVVTVKTTTIPDLASLFRLTVDDAIAALGDDYVITKTDEAEDQDNPAVKQLVVLTYQPQESSGAPLVSVVMPSVYLSLDSEEIVVGVYFMSSLEMLGYPSASFVSFVHTEDMLFNALRVAKVVPAADYKYPALTAADYTVYVDPTAVVKRVKKEEYVFNGSTDSEDAPTFWQLKLSYDYGAIGVPQGSSISPNQRTISISLR